MAAPTAALVNVTKYNLRYLLTADNAGGTLTLTASGAATPDLVTDTATVLGSPMARLARAGTVGIGPLAAAAVTQAISRTLFMSDGTIAGTSFPGVPQCKVTVHPRTGVAAGCQWAVDADAAVGLPTFTIIPSAVVGTAYLDFQVRHSIWF